MMVEKTIGDSHSGESVSQEPSRFAYTCDILPGAGRLTETHVNTSVSRESETCVFIAVRQVGEKPSHQKGQHCQHIPDFPSNFLVGSNGDNGDEI